MPSIGPILFACATERLGGIGLSRFQEPSECCQFSRQGAHWPHKGGLGIAMSRTTDRLTAVQDLQNPGKLGVVEPCDRNPGPNRMALCDPIQGETSSLARDLRWLRFHDSSPAGDVSAGPKRIVLTPPLLGDRNRILWRGLDLPTNVDVRSLNLDSLASSLQRGSWASVPGRQDHSGIEGRRHEPASKLRNRSQDLPFRLDIASTRRIEPASARLD